LEPVSFAVLASALGSKTRLQILRELATSDGLLVVELAERVRLRHPVVSDHMKVLREAGMVVKNRAGMYVIAPGRLVSKELGALDFGCCQLKLRGHA
jgi:DNA-binding transcriptional ArsR family regulator